MQLVWPDFSTPHRSQSISVLPIDCSASTHAVLHSILRLLFPQQFHTPSWSPPPCLADQPDPLLEVDQATVCMFPCATVLSTVSFVLFALHFPSLHHHFPMFLSHVRARHYSELVCYACHILLLCRRSVTSLFGFFAHVSSTYPGIHPHGSRGLLEPALEGGRVTLSDYRLHGHRLGPSSNETFLSTLGTHHYPTCGDLRVSGSLPHRVRRCRNS